VPPGGAILIVQSLRVMWRSFPPSRRVAKVNWGQRNSRGLPTQCILVAVFSDGRSEAIRQGAEIP
jgi:hypothetical protein